MQASKKYKVVTIGGGTGHFVLLTALRSIEGLDLKAIVTMTDSGGSSGRLRDELGVLPPGDVRQCLTALSSSPAYLRELFTYRFSEGELAGHSFGNLCLSALEKVTGSFDNAVRAASEILDLKGEVIPVTLDKTDLMMELKDGAVLENEDQIQTSKQISKAGIKDIYFSKKPEVNQRAIEAIKEADVIILSSGHIFCAISAILTISEIGNALMNSRAKKIHVANLMNLEGQNDNWTYKNYFDQLESFIGGGFLDYVLINTKEPEPILLERYKDKSNELPIILNKKELEKQSYQVIYADLLSNIVRVPSRADNTNRIERCFIRHDEEKLAKILSKIIKE